MGGEQAADGFPVPVFASGAQGFSGCGDRVYIADVGIKTVTDHGGGLGTAQLDNFTTAGRCSGIVDIGDKKVFKLPVGGT